MSRLWYIKILLPLVFSWSPSSGAGNDLVPDTSLQSLRHVNLAENSKLFTSAIKLYKEGLRAYIRGDYLYAEKKFLKALTLDPLHEELFQLLSSVKRKKGIKEVVDLQMHKSTVAVKPDGSNIQDIYELGTAFYLAGDIKRADPLWKKIENFNVMFFVMLFAIVRSNK